LSRSCAASPRSRSSPSSACHGRPLHSWLARPAQMVDASTARRGSRLGRAATSGRWYATGCGAKADVVPMPVRPGPFILGGRPAWPIWGEPGVEPAETLLAGRRRTRPGGPRDCHQRSAGQCPDALHRGEYSVRRRPPPRRHEIGDVRLDRGVLDPRRRIPQHHTGEYRPQIRREDQRRHGRHHEWDPEENLAAVSVEQVASGQRYHSRCSRADSDLHRRADHDRAADRGLPGLSVREGILTSSP
jgi:hypothetical protein